MMSGYLVYQNLSGKGTMLGQFSLPAGAVLGREEKDRLADW